MTRWTCLALAGFSGRRASKRHSFAGNSSAEADPSDNWSKFSHCAVSIPANFVRLSPSFAKPPRARNQAGSTVQPEWNFSGPKAQFSFVYKVWRWGEAAQNIKEHAS